MRLITVTVKVSYDDDKGRRKSRNERYLVECRDFSHAIEIVTEEFEGASEVWEISRITPANINSILNYGSTGKLNTNEFKGIPETVLT
jgi:hypothetical protein